MATFSCVASCIPARALSRRPRGGAGAGARLPPSAAIGVHLQPHRHFQGRRMVVLRRAENEDPGLDEASLKRLEDEAEEFMRLQAAEESGSGSAEAEAAKPAVITTTSGVTNEDVQRYLNEIFEIVQDLDQKRFMNSNEIKLTLMIEDPRVAERRRKLGIEADTGVSREELAAAFDTVVKGGVPEDRLALKVLAEEMAEWPFLDGSSQGEAPSGRKISAVADTGDEKDTAGLPDFVGYGMLYGVSAVPIFIVVAVVAVLFVNSLR